MKINGLLPLLWVSACAIPTVRAEDFSLRVMAQESLPPKWLSRNGQAEGVCPDILAAIEKTEPQLHFSGKEDYRSVPMIENALGTGMIDCACALLDTARRHQVANIAGKPLYQVKQRVAVAAGDNLEIETLADLARINPQIATSRGAGYAEQLRAMGLKVDDSTGDNLVNLRKIMAGHGRVFYMNELTLSWIVHDNGLSDKVRILPAVLKEDPIYFWVSKKTNPAAARLVDQALLKLHASGELARIYDRWNNER